MGLDLRDVYRPGGGPTRLTPRRVLALVEHPREGGPLWAAKAAEPPPLDATPAEMGHHGWTLDRHFLAAIVDLLQAANFQRGGGKGSAPKPVPRPAAPKQRVSGRDYLRAGRPKARRVAGG
ncbi:hypothetical protein ACWEFJ_28450 [Actinosynnema sp. NPDC004786]